MCLYPTLIRNRKYLPNKKNKYNPPLPKDERVLYVPIACEECIECRTQKMNQWRTRLTEDIKQNTNGKFLCLTFSNEAIARYYKEVDKEIKTLQNRIEIEVDEKESYSRLNKITSYGKDNEAATIAVRAFLERWRRKYTKSLRHWLVTELGHKGTQNIHMHGIVWPTITNNWEYNLLEVERIWNNSKEGPNGFVWKWDIEYGQRINWVNEQTINYMVKYIHKQDLDHKLYKPKILTSDGIGGQYPKAYNARYNKFQGIHTDESYTLPNGRSIAIPIYWRNKIYTEDERETLWLQRLDKQERWVCGEKIDLTKGDKKYWQLLEYHRQRNTQLGYGNGKTNWAREIYEKETREIMQQTRIKNAENKRLRREV